MIISENGIIHHDGIKLENPFDSGYTTGQGIFETILIFNGKPKFLKAHYDRILSSSKKMCLPSLPEFIVVEEWVNDYLSELYRSNINENKSNLSFKGRMRINWVKNIDAYGNKNADMHIYAMEFSYPEEYYQKGIKVGISNEKIYSQMRFTGIKTLNYAENLLKKAEAASNGFKEMIVLNENGNVCEGITSNIFWIKDGKIFTPELESGALPGIIRSWVIDNSRILGYPVVEGTFVTEVVVSSDAIFFTNSLMGIMPVSGIIGIPKAFSENKILKELSEKYMSDLEAETD